jgi:hypothetical protein
MVDFKRRKYEQAIAAEIAQELHACLGSTMMPEDLVGQNRDVVCEVFGRVFDRHQVVSEVSGARILGYVPKLLANAARK